MTPTRPSCPVRHPPSSVIIPHLNLPVGATGAGKQAGTHLYETSPASAGSSAAPGQSSPWLRATCRRTMQQETRERSSRGAFQLRRWITLVTSGALARCSLGRATLRWDAVLCDALQAPSRREHAGCRPASCLRTCRRVAEKLNRMLL